MHRDIGACCQLVQRLAIFDVGEDRRDFRREIKSRLRRRSQQRPDPCTSRDQSVDHSGADEAARAGDEEDPAFQAASGLSYDH
jgi:hypothetical protein